MILRFDHLRAELTTTPELTTATAV
jgi:hypothetical protein